MTAQVNLTIRMFGAFRKYHQGNLSIAVATGSSIAEIKSKIVSELQMTGSADADLVNKSVLADSMQILKESEIVSEDLILAILPPVCGG